MTTLPKVLHIQKVNGVAGSENHLLSLIPELKHAGYQPTMLVLADRDDRPELFVQRMQSAGVATEVVPMMHDIDPLLILRLKGWFTKERFDIIHTHLFHAGVHGRPPAWASGARIISSYHNCNPFFTKIGVKQVERLTARTSDQVICISEAVRTFVHQHINVPDDRLHVIHYGIRAQPKTTTTSLRSLYNIPATDIIIGVVARLVEQKGHKYLLEAVRLLRDIGVPIQLMIIGDGVLRKRLEHMTTDLNLSSRVHFLGYRTDVNFLMQDLDIFVLPSLFEGFGLVLLEAMAASLPVVATGVGPIPEIVRDGQTGYLVPARDPNALANALRVLALDPDKARMFGERGHTLIKESFSVEAMVRKTADVYATVLR